MAYLALNDDNPPLVVYTDPPWVLQDVSPELPNELSVLIIDLNLVSRRPN